MPQKPILCLSLLGFLIFLMLFLPGCTRIFPQRGIIVPADFQEPKLASELLDSATRRKAYSRLFPPLAKVQFRATLTAKNRLKLHKDYFECAYLALNQGTDAIPPLRMGGSYFGKALFDLLVINDTMSVAWFPDRQLFDGSVSRENSPFGRRFGVNPWDIVQIFTIGQRIATGDFKVKAGLKATTLNAANENQSFDEFERITIENKTGLPRAAIRTLKNNRYEIQYSAWDYFTDGQLKDETRLMPKRINVHCRKPRINLNLDINSYQFNPQYSEKAFKMPDYPDYRRLPLDALAKVLGPE